MKRFFFVTQLILFINPLFSQVVKTTENLQQVWFGYFNQSRFNDKWGLWIDLQLRTKDDFASDLSTSIVRAGITYYINDATKITAGYAWVNHFPQDNHKEVLRPEHRPWQQIQWHTTYAKKRMMQWIRLDERFRRKILNDSVLADGYNFNYKLRYNIWYEVPLSKKGIVPGAFSFIINDEVHINFGKQVVNNYFDQNRFFTGFKYQLNAHSNFQAGYTNVFQQLAAGNRYKNINGIRLSYLHNTDLRRKN